MEEITKWQDHDMKVDATFLTPQMRPLEQNEVGRISVSPFSLGCSSPKENNHLGFSPRPHSLSVNFNSVQRTIRKLKPARTKLEPGNKSSYKSSLKAAIVGKVIFIFRLFI